MNTTIRPMQVADIDEVAALEGRLQFHPWSARQFLDSLAMNHPSWVALQAGCIVGFAVTMHVLDEATLLEIGVAPELQRSGVGGRLMAAISDAATEAGMAVMHLEVRVGNKAARSLYRKLGFKDVGKRRAYYRAPVCEATPDGREDAILMALTLDEGAR